MGVLVSALVQKARNILNDRYDDHFASDDVSDAGVGAVDGTNVRFRAVNQNLVGIVDGAPADPVLLVNGSQVSATVNKQTGIYTAASAPGAGSVVTLDYYFVLVTDATWIDFAAQAAEFVGVTPQFTLLTQDSKVSALLEDACARYMASLGADKMANLSGWYYSVNAEGKGFDKNTISAKFTAMAKEQRAKALESRDDVYKRQGQRNAPAYKLANISFPSYTPSR